MRDISERTGRYNCTSGPADCWQYSHRTSLIDASTTAHIGAYNLELGGPLGTAAALVRRSEGGGLRWSRNLFSVFATSVEEPAEQRAEPRRASRVQSAERATAVTCGHTGVVNPTKTNTQHPTRSPCAVRPPTHPPARLQKQKGPLVNGKMFFSECYVVA
jgi:hypothetical protein